MSDTEYLPPQCGAAPEWEDVRGEARITTSYHDPRRRDVRAAKDAMSPKTYPITAPVLMRRMSILLARDGAVGGGYCCCALGLECGEHEPYVWDGDTFTARADDDE